MRVALVCGNYSPRQDGVADYVGRVASSLRDSGVDPVVASSARSAGPCVQLCPTWDLRGVRTAARRLEAMRPDVVHVQWAPSAFSWSPWAGLLPRLTSAPVVTTLHEYGWWTWPARVPRRAWRPLERTGLWDHETMLLGPRSAAVVTTNLEHAGHVRRRLGREPALVPIGPNVGATGLSRPAAGALVQERWGLPAGAPLLVFFGFVHPVKGVRYLLEALAAVRFTPQGRGARLVVAGGFESLALPGAEARDFRAELVQHARSSGVSDAVTFTGHVGDAEVSQLLHAADAVVLPLTAGVTLKSGAVLAAFDHGAPVVATLPDGGGSPELVDGETVVAIPRRRDSGAVAEAVSRLLADEALRARVAEGGRQLAGRRSWPVIARQHVELYDRVLADARR